MAEVIGPWQVAFKPRMQAGNARLSKQPHRGRGHGASGQNVMPAWIRMPTAITRLRIIEIPFPSQIAGFLSTSP